MFEWCHRLITADDQQFDKFLCPPFKGLEICCLQFGDEDTEEMKHQIEAGGKCWKLLFLD